MKVELCQRCGREIGVSLDADCFGDESPRLCDTCRAELGTAEAAGTIISESEKNN
jgi:hypothetical protein